MRGTTETTRHPTTNSGGGATTGGKGQITMREWRVGGAVDGVESRGRDVSGAGWACGGRDRDCAGCDATVGDDSDDDSEAATLRGAAKRRGRQGQRRRRRGVGESEATVGDRGDDDIDEE
ncbi:hypothetical protein PM022_18130 [Halorubrum ezzemoulense]|uniref:hypothetical protein n=1 Tax=Halorubrum ezzemoulense TaxID=337243 RepID=UPI002331251D|nr:hypothetical protein [Halorubrum ezzemoulense]MDB2276410.1 hypothetical protein [Halorubrum ezzemoulense]